jgi:hypothetical protein
MGRPPNRISIRSTIIHLNPKEGRPMLKKGYAITLAVLLAWTVIAVASNVHLKGGPSAEPSFTDNGLTLTSSGDLTGLGNGDVLVILSARANPTARCCTPGGSCKVPGQNPASVNVTGSESIPASEVKNGNVTFGVTTDPPTTPIPGAPDCPNSGWTESITDLAFTSATITVMQGGSTVFTTTCTFSSPTSDGRVSAQNVTCS